MHIQINRNVLLQVSNVEFKHRCMLKIFKIADVLFHKNGKAFYSLSGICIPFIFIKVAISKEAINYICAIDLDKVVEPEHPP